MHVPVNRYLLSLAASALLLSLPGPARAKEEREARPPPATSEGRWVPALAITPGITAQSQDSTVRSSCLRGGAPQENRLKVGFFDPPCQNPSLNMPFELRRSDSGTDLALSPYVGASLQLMAPSLPIPGRPRFFLTGEILPTFATGRDIAKEGDASGLRILPPGPGSPTGAPQPPNAVGFTPCPITAATLAASGCFDELAVLGTGSKTTSTVQKLVWGAGIGIAFPFEGFGRRFRLKPSFRWLRYSVDLNGTAIRAIRPRTAVPPPPLSSTTAGPLRRVNLSGSDSLTLNGIGPGLELEMDAFRWGPIGASFFLDAYAYRILGTRSVRFNSDRVTLTGADDVPADPSQGLAPDTYNAAFTWSADPWLFRGGVGLRLHWLGSAGR